MKVDVITECNVNDNHPLTRTYFLFTSRFANWRRDQKDFSDAEKRQLYQGLSGLTSTRTSGNAGSHIQGGGC